MIQDFLKHMFPRVVLEKNLRIRYTLCLGGLAFTAFMLMIASGMLLLVYYQPTPERAFNSIIFLESVVWGGKFIRSLHRMTSHALLLLLVFHALRVILTGAWQPPRQLNWVIGMLLLQLCVFEAYSGYLLPMDQLAYWATQTGMELLLTAPFGKFVHTLLVPDGVGQPLSLLRFYALHAVYVPSGIVLFSFLHFYRVRKNKGVLPYL
jgi:quinol-cytochrome oxidoreductase complex cytochrome b subunit